SSPAAAAAVESVLVGSTADLSGLVDGRLVAVVRRRPLPSSELPLLVVSPSVPVESLPPIYDICRHALAAAGPSLRGLHSLGELGLITATTSVPALGPLLAGELLGSLSPADPFHREL